MIVDAHCHAWRRWPYDPTVDDRSTRGSAETLLDRMDDAGVEFATVVCAKIGGDDPRTDNGDNDDYVTAAVRAHPDRLGAFIDVDSMWSRTHHRPGAAERLAAALDRFSPTGIAHYVSAPDDGWLASDEGIAFFSVAADAGVPVSIQLEPDAQPSLRVLARVLPTLTLLVQHQGLARQGPGHESSLAQVIASADIPNIAVKFTGFHYLGAAGETFPFPTAQQTARRVFDAYGADRLLWGSDFPASRDHMSYRQSLDLVRELCDFIPSTDLATLLGGAASALIGRAPHASTEGKRMTP